MSQAFMQLIKQNDLEFCDYWSLFSWKPMDPHQFIITYAITCLLIHSPPYYKRVLREFTHMYISTIVTPTTTT